jgi:hypothetical protein
MACFSRSAHGFAHIGIIDAVSIGNNQVQCGFERAPESEKEFNKSLVIDGLG